MNKSEGLSWQSEYLVLFTSDGFIVLSAKLLKPPLWVSALLVEIMHESSSEREKLLLSYKRISGKLDKAG